MSRQPRLSTVVRGQYPDMESTTGRRLVPQGHEPMTYQRDLLVVILEAIGMAQNPAVPTSLLQARFEPIVARTVAQFGGPGARNTMIFLADLLRHVYTRLVDSEAAMSVLAATLYTFAGYYTALHRNPAFAGPDFDEDRQHVTDIVYLFIQVLQALDIDAMAGTNFMLLDDETDARLNIELNHLRQQANELVHPRDDEGDGQTLMDEVVATATRAPTLADVPTGRQFARQFGTHTFTRPNIDPRAFLVGLEQFLRYSARDDIDYGQFIEDLRQEIDQHLMEVNEVPLSVYEHALRQTMTALENPADPALAAMIMALYPPAL